MEWNIQSRSLVCQGCGRGFRDLEPLHTLLYDERHSYRRLDVCETCWAGQFSQGASDRKGFVSHWQSVLTAPAPAPPEPIQRETAEGLLRKLIEVNDPRHAGACFILAVMLERKRLLKIKAQAVEEGRRVLVYEQPKTGDVFTIIDPNLQFDQLDAVQRDVAALLEHGLDTPAAEAPAPAAPTPPAGDSVAAPVMTPAPLGPAGADVAARTETVAGGGGTEPGPEGAPSPPNSALVAAESGASEQARAPSDG